MLPTLESLKPLYQLQQDEPLLALSALFDIGHLLFEVLNSGLLRHGHLEAWPYDKHPHVAASAKFLNQSKKQKKSNGKAYGGRPEQPWSNSFCVPLTSQLTSDADASESKRCSALAIGNLSESWHVYAMASHKHSNPDGTLLP